MAQPYIGEIRMFAGNFAPSGWLFCDGQLLPISEHDALFTLIGTAYGGDGESTFALPNLQSRIPLHMGTGPDGINYPFAQMAGQEEVTLTIQQIPNHTHALVASTQQGNEARPSGNVLSNSQGAMIYLENTANVPMNPSAIGAVGGSQPHSNMQPYLCINFIISLYGIFPSQS